MTRPPKKKKKKKKDRKKCIKFYSDKQETGALFHDKVQSFFDWFYSWNTKFKVNGGWIWTRKRFKITLFIMTRHNLWIFGITRFIKLQTDTKVHKVSMTSIYIKYNTVPCRKLRGWGGGGGGVGGWAEIGIVKVCIDMFLLSSFFLYIYMLSLLSIATV